MRILIPSLFLLCLWSCLPSLQREDLTRKGPISFQEREFKEPLVDDSSKDLLFLCLERSMIFLEKKGALQTNPGFPEGKFSPRNVHRSLSLFREILSGTSDEVEVDRKIRENFIFWEPDQQNSSSSIFLTGYYEPILDGSLEPGEIYRYPLYRRPADLEELPLGEIPLEGATGKRIVRWEYGRGVPYYSRREIDTEGALQGKKLEIVWLKDPWERFVLHIQGSGQIRLPDGRTIRVGYDASNGRPYRSIGRYLIDQGLLNEKDISMEQIREFIQNNPGRAEEIFNVNERYIFFRLLPESEGPLGALGVPVTPGRSVAMDLTLFPPGALAYLVSRQPDWDESGRMVGWKPLRRFVLTQDAGNAIKGPGRVDLFFGSGEMAGKTAGEMREEGKIYFLLAK